MTENKDSKIIFNETIYCDKDYFANGRPILRFVHSLIKDAPKNVDTIILNFYVTKRPFDDLSKRTMSIQHTMSKKEFKTIKRRDVFDSHAADIALFDNGFSIGTGISILPVLIVSSIEHIDFLISCSGFVQIGLEINVNK